MLVDPQRIDQHLAQFDSGRQPGVAVGVSAGGRVVYRRAFGRASLELPVLLSPGMRMRVGSVSKQFAALAFLLLCEAGKASPEDSVSDHFPEHGGAFDGVTVRDLMCHQSGLRDMHDLCFQFSGTGREISSADLIEAYKFIRSRNFPPRTAWNYNNGGYLILSSIIERITGETLEAHLKSAIFEPLGLHDTLLRRHDRDFVENSATLHMTKTGGGFERSYMGMDFAGEGGVVSTVDDMLRWMAHMDRPVLGSPATWEAMRTPKCMANGASTGYGFGLIRGEHNGHRTLYHSGGGMGGNAHMLKVPDLGLDIIVITNRHDVLAMDLGYAILDVVAEPRRPAEGDNHERRFSAAYHSARTGRVLELSVEGRDAVVAVDGMDWPFVLKGTREEPLLAPAPTWQMINQTVAFDGGQDPPARVFFRDSGDVDELERVAVEPTHADERICGDFVSDETRARLTLAQVDGGFTLQSVGPHGTVTYVLDPLRPRLWRARLTGTMQWLGGIVTLRDDGDLEFSSIRTTRLHFRREADLR